MRIGLILTGGSARADVDQAIRAEAAGPASVVPIEVFNRPGYAPRGDDLCHMPQGHSSGSRSKLVQLVWRSPAHTVWLEVLGVQRSTMHVLPPALDTQLHDPQFGSNPNVVSWDAIL